MTTTTEARTVLRAQGLTRVFGTGAGEVRALADATLEVAAGELLVVREDIGRHNAVDKVIGWAAREGRPRWLRTVRGPGIPGPRSPAGRRRR